jgi:hypothetical protein
VTAASCCTGMDGTFWDIVVWCCCVVLWLVLRLAHLVIGLLLQFFYWLLVMVYEAIRYVAWSLKLLLDILDLALGFLWTMLRILEYLMELFKMIVAS